MSEFDKVEKEINSLLSDAEKMHEVSGKCLEMLNKARELTKKSKEMMDSLKSDKVPFIENSSIIEHDSSKHTSLGEVIFSVLSRKKEGMTAVEIRNVILEEDLWRDRHGGKLKNQVVNYLSGMKKKEIIIRDENKLYSISKGVTSYKG